MIKHSVVIFSSCNAKREFEILVELQLDPANSNSILLNSPSF